MTPDLSSVDKTAIQKVIEDNKITLWLNTTGELASKLPLYLLEGGWADSGKMISCVHASDEDAKVAAQENGDSSFLSYSVSFEDTTTPRTKVVHISSSLLLQGALVDPLVSRYSIIYIHQYHVRTIQMDIVIGLLKKVLKKRENLRVLISGASPESLDFLSVYLIAPPKISLEANTYPVDLHYVNISPGNYVDTALDVVLSSTKPLATGGIIVFMPSRDIGRFQDQLRESLRLAEVSMNVDALFSVSELLRLESSVLDFEHPAHVIVTSLPAELVARRLAVTVVIDTGFEEVKYSRYGFATVTKVEPVSQEVANIRTRIAGLSKAGRCYRLYPQNSFENLEKTRLPEIGRLALDHCILQLKSLGVDNILHFDYPHPPPSHMLAEAIDRLASLGVIDNEAHLTRPFGENVAQLPLEPSHAILLVSSLQYGCFEQIASLVALSLTKGDYFDHEKWLPFIAQEGDALTWLNIYESFLRMGRDKSWCRKYGFNETQLSRSVNIRDQLLRILQHRRIKIAKTELATSTAIRKCIASTYRRNLAFRLPDGSYQTMSGSLIMKIHPSSVLHVREALCI
ncbi:hypothetical protein TWF694_001602 [Orbilia ellipsospora]|uniref:Helicase-associated domain-containing protein n=1 Tax=Orbilia ellipsospora TaxID=2528407 RepID=A0AAV9X941_9PEZI